MCEFEVILDGEVIAHKVIKAKEKNGKVIMADTKGEVTKVEGVRIVGVDTIMTELTLQRVERGAKPSNHFRV